jgi:hypothetical protein
MERGGDEEMRGKDERCRERAGSGEGGGERERRRERRDEEAVRGGVDGRSGSCFFCGLRDKTTAAWTHRLAVCCTKAPPFRLSVRKQRSNWTRPHYDTNSPPHNIPPNSTQCTQAHTPTHPFTPPISSHPPTHPPQTTAHPVPTPPNTHWHTAREHVTSAPYKSQNSTHTPTANITTCTASAAPCR